MSFIWSKLIMNSLIIISLILLATKLTTTYSSVLSSPPTPLFRTRVFGYGPEPETKSSYSTNNSLKTYFYKQTIDHFTYSPESYSLFNQRYYVKESNWGGSYNNSPIFVYLGDEQALDYEFVDGSLGIFEEHASHFQALIVYIEHRFYGKSNPIGSMAKSIANPKLRGYLNSAQALADYAEIILDIRKRYRATHSPIIVFGVSYGGMLATWFRLKFPHIALGALASSAPILQHIISRDAYLQVITKDFNDTSEKCYKTIKESWTHIMNLGSQSNGLQRLNKKFNTCSPLSVETIIYDLLFATYIVAAQYDFPPYYPVATICKGIDGAPKSADVIDKVYAGLVSLFGDLTCITGSEASQVAAKISPADDGLSDTSLGWPWQACSEMVSFANVTSVGINDTESMFRPIIGPYDRKATLQECKSTYGVLPRPNWVETYYGGQDIKLVLERFGSNIIFSNGLRDPYSSAGVLEDLSDTLKAISTPLGAHGLDMQFPSSDDPDWLIAMRKKEIKIIKGWLTQYYADLIAQS